MRTSDPVPAPDRPDAAATPRPARRVLPRLAAAGVAAALVGGGVASATAEPSPAQPLAFSHGWPVKWTGSCC